jgi:hypothetical protein
VAGAALVLVALPLRWWGTIAAQRRQASPVAATVSSWQEWQKAPGMGGCCASRWRGPHHNMRPQNGRTEDRRAEPHINTGPCSAPVQNYHESAQ